MKYLFFILCLALVGCGSTGHSGGSSKQKVTKYQMAIQKVLDSRSNIRQVISHVPQNASELAVANNDPSAPIFNIQDYAKRLSNISFKECPQDFKEAFVQYAEAWNDRAGANPTLDLPLVGASGIHVESDSEAAALTESTWRALQVVVTKYMTPETKGKGKGD